MSDRSGPPAAALPRSPDRRPAAAAEARASVQIQEAPAVSSAADASLLASFRGDGSIFSEQFRTCRARLHQIADTRSTRCLGVVSAIGGEGKTSIALGFALSLGRETVDRTLVIDADLRRRCVEGYLGLPAAPGLAEWLVGDSPLLQVRHLAAERISLLGGGLAETVRPDLLASPRMAALLEAARSEYDWVIVDCPPLVPVADSLYLQDLVDGFLLVVRSRLSPRESIEEAVASLKRDRILGVIFNGYQELLPSYHSYGYRKYRGYR
jgi:capsular exopolysaccharide synthesis family protein